MSKVLKCSQCSYSTDRTYNFNRHVKKHDVRSDVSACLTPTNVNDISLDVNNQSIDVNNALENVNTTVNIPANDNINITDVNTTLQVIKCNNCYKTFQNQWNLKKHQPLCKFISNPFECCKCKKVFSCRQSKSYHQKQCKGTSETLVVVNKNETAVVPNTCTQLPSVTNVHTVSRDLVQNQTNNVNNVNIQINIHGYGNENVDHITDAFKEARIHEINGHGIYNMIKSIHFNPEYPENHNIRRYDSKYCKIYDDNEWMLRSMKTALEDLVKRYKYQLIEYMMDDERRKSKMANETDAYRWKELFTYLAAFDKDTKPADFYRTIRDVTTLMETMEQRYAKSDLSNST